MKVIKVENNLFIIKFTYEERFVSLCRTLTEASFDGRRKAWKAPVNKFNVGRIHTYFFPLGFLMSSDEKVKLDIATEEEKIEAKRLNEVEEASFKESSDIEIEGLKLDLFNYQKAGVEFIEINNGKALIADEMGLGKTAQSIAYLQHKKSLPALIVCPSTLKYNWANEIDKFTDLTSLIITGGKEVDISGYDCVIMNYEILSKHTETCIDNEFQTIIVDECHNVKNPTAKRTKYLQAIQKHIPHKIFLSGTPLLNRPIELFTTLNMLCPDKFSNYWSYAKKFCGAYKGRWGWDVSGSSNREELSKMLRQNIMIRREKQNVLKDLPDKVRTVIPHKVDLTDYNRIEEDFYEYLDSIGRGVGDKTEEELEKFQKAEQMTKIEYMKQEAVLAKANLFIQFVKEFMETDKSLIVFAHHTDYIEFFEEELKEYKPLKIVGGMGDKNKQKSVDDFQQGKSRIILCSIKAAGVGVTLTKASDVIFLELDWTPAIHLQAEDRAHRIGQKDSVNAYYFLAKNTIEEDIYKLLQSKEKVFKALMSSEQSEGFETANIKDDLIKLLTEKGKEKNLKKKS